MPELTKKLTEDFLRPYTPQQVSVLLSVAMEMEAYGITPADVVHICNVYLGELVSQFKAAEDLAQQSAGPDRPARQATPQLRPPACPDCGGATSISAVNVSKCTAIGGGWRTSIVCSNPDCRFTDLSTKTIDDWRK